MGMYKVAGLELKNPTTNASGVLSEIHRLYKWQDAGVGALVTKTTTLDERIGDNILKRFDFGTLNRIGLTNPGLSGAIGLFEQYGHMFTIPVIGSIIAEYEKELAIGLSPYVDAFEVNLSCPNVEKRMLKGYDVDEVKKVCKNVLNVTKKPVIAKLPPYIFGNEEAELLKPLEQYGVTLRAPLHSKDELQGVVSMLESIGMNGITMCNTIAVSYLNDEIGKFDCGLSATDINKEITMRNIKAAREVSDIDILASGGVKTKKDADDYFAIGANAVQLGSGVYRMGIKKFVSQFIST